MGMKKFPSNTESEGKNLKIHQMS